MSGLIAKCLGAPKAKTKDMAVQIALMYVEIEKYEIVQEELMKGITTQKNPKVVAACIGTLSQALRYASPYILMNHYLQAILGSKLTLNHCCWLCFLQRIRPQSDKSETSLEACTRPSGRSWQERARRRQEIGGWIIQMDWTSLKTAVVSVETHSGTFFPFSLGSRL